MDSKRDNASTIDRLWVPSEEEIWSPCTLVDQHKGKASFVAPSGLEIAYPAAKIKDLEHAEDIHLQGVDDICSLSFVNEGALLHAVRTRFFDQLIYTRVARILIAVNPFEALPIYSTQARKTYERAVETMDLPPHIFAVAQEAMLGLRAKLVDRIILISGESGAGKTESAKLCLSFVSGSVQTEQGGIEDMVLQTSAIFEAFGNSMTLRNNNSSRFGKLLDIQFSRSMRMLGCTLKNYLLETTRVCSQSAKERNYHIFYQLLKARWAAGPNDFGVLNSAAPWLEQHLLGLGLGAPEDYHYLQGLKDAPGIDDLRFFRATLDAFWTLGFDESIQKDVLTLLAGVLSLGNCEFVLDRIGNTDKAVFKKNSDLENTALLLGVNVQALSQCLLVRKLVVCSDVTTINLTDVQARATRDTLARVLYGSLFDWLKNMMNKALGFDTGGKEKSASLGVLDIAGFESLEKNSLEQLLINLSNEFLQKSFNDTIFKSELDDYESEDVTLPPSISFRDNANILDLIDGKAGVLALLDDEMSLGKATDQTYTAKVQKSFAKSCILTIPRFNKELSFGIMHFAGEVMYCTDGFLEKNAEKMPDDLATLWGGSNLKLLQLLANDLNSEVAAAGAAAAAKIAGGGARGGKPRTSASLKFRASLRSLTEHISNSERHYIRCIKPNAAKVCQVFESKAVMEQLLLSGILEAVHIRQQGFSARLLYADFFFRYQVIINFPRKGGHQYWYAGDKDPKKSARNLMEQLAGDLGSVAREVCFGRTKVFVTATATDHLERLRGEAIERAATLIESVARMFLVRHRTQAIKELGAKLKMWLKNAWIESRDQLVWNLPPGSALEHLGSDEAAQKALSTATPLFEKVTATGLKNGTCYAVQQFARRIQKELKAVADIESLARSMDPMAIEQAFARVLPLEIPDRSSWPKLRKRMRALQVQLPLIQSLRAVLAYESIHMGDVDFTTQLAACLREVEAVEEWVPELNDTQLLERAAAIYESLLELESMGTSIDIGPIQSALVHAQALELLELPSRAKLESRLSILQVQRPLSDVLYIIASGEEVRGLDVKLKDVVEKLRATGLDTHLGRWLPELGCTGLIPEALAQHAALLQLEAVVETVDLAVLGDALQQARQAGLQASLVKCFESRFGELKGQLPLVEAMERILAGAAGWDVEIYSVVAEIKDQGLDTGEAQWLGELQGKELMQKVLKWHDVVVMLEALSTSIDVDRMSTALQRAKEAGVPERGILTKHATRLERVRLEAHHISELEKALALQALDESGTDPDADLKLYMKSLESAGLKLTSEAWLPEFGADALIGKVSARKVALYELKSLEWSVELDKIRNALVSATDAGLPQGSASKLLELRLKVLEIQVPLIERMDAVLTSETTGTDVQINHDKRLQTVAEKLTSCGFRSSPGQWLDGLSGAALCADVFKRYDVMICIQGLASSTDPQEIESAMLQAQVVGLPWGAALCNLDARSKQLNMELPLLDAMKEALAKQDEQMLKAMMNKLEASRKHQTSAWLPELGAAQFLTDVSSRHNVLLELEALSTSLDVDIITKALKRADEVGLSAYLITTRLKQHLPKLVVQLKLLDDMMKVQWWSGEKLATAGGAASGYNSTYDGLVKDVCATLIAQQLDTHPAYWLPEIDGAALASTTLQKHAALESLASADLSFVLKDVSLSLEQARKMGLPQKGDAASLLLVRVLERHALLSKLSALSTGVEVSAIKEALGEATEKGWDQSDPVLLLARRLEALHSQLPLEALLREVLALRDGDHDCDGQVQQAYVQVLTANTKWKPELEGAKLFKQVEARHNAVVKLQKLSKSIDASAIKMALKEADSASLPEGVASTNALERLDKLQIQLPHIGALQAVLKTSAEGDERLPHLQKMKKFLTAVERDGLKQPDEWLPELAGAKLVAEATRRVSVTKAEVRTERMINAAQLYKQRLSSATGARLNNKIMDQLELAADRYDARALALHLGDATKNGLDMNGLVQFRLLLQQLQSESFIEHAIHEATEEASKPGDPDTTQLWRLMNLSDQLQSISGDENLMRTARLTVTVVSRQSAALKEGDQDAAGFESLFADIEKFHGLKHNRKSAGPAMKFSQFPITEAMSNCGDAKSEQEAISNFRNIMVWMCDRPASDLERQSAADSVVRLLRLNDDLTDEIFIQVLKQLIHNPSLRSIALGWELLASLCKSMTPSDQFLSFFINFLDSHAEAKGKQVAEQARRCLTHVASFQKLQRLQGTMWKSRPDYKGIKRGMAQRYFILRNLHLYWWNSKGEALQPEASAPNGGPKCKGFISLATTNCNIAFNKAKLAGQAQAPKELGQPPKGLAPAQANSFNNSSSFNQAGKSFNGPPSKGSGNPFCFQLVPDEGQWTKVKMEKHAERVFAFDVTGSELSRDKWCKGIAEHIEHANYGKTTRLDGLVQAFFLQTVTVVDSGHEA